MGMNIDKESLTSSIWTSVYSNQFSGNGGGVNAVHICGNVFKIEFQCWQTNPGWNWGNHAYHRIIIDRYDTPTHVWVSVYNSGSFAADSDRTYTYFLNAIDSTNWRCGVDSIHYRFRINLSGLRPNCRLRIYQKPLGNHYDYDNIIKSTQIRSKEGTKYQIISADNSLDPFAYPFGDVTSKRGSYILESDDKLNFIAVNL